MLAACSVSLKRNLRSVRSFRKLVLRETRMWSKLEYETSHWVSLESVHNKSARFILFSCRRRASIASTKLSLFWPNFALCGPYSRLCPLRKIERHFFSLRQGLLTSQPDISRRLHFQLKVGAIPSYINAFLLLFCSSQLCGHQPRPHKNCYHPWRQYL